MLDPRLVTADPERVKDNMRRRRAADEAFTSVDRMVALSAERTDLVAERDGLRGERNTLSREIGGLLKEGRSDEAAAVKQRVSDGKVRIEVLEARLGELELEQSDLAMALPNLLHDSVPDGASEDDNREVRRWGTPREFDFEPLAHVEVGERLGVLDLERSAKLTGARFSVLYGDGARLERALISWFLDLHTREHGYREVMVPYIVHRKILEGTGQLPKFEDDMFKLAGQLNGSDAFLIPTAEVPVTNLHREEILDATSVPVKYVCFTPCFRSEAGSAGRDMRGLIRTHQFHKVELVWVTEPEHSAAAHEELVRHAETCLMQLGLPFRTVELCAGDTSFNAARCFDLEVWLPSQQGYREISSCSTFGDFQARRMGLRYRPARPAGVTKKQKPRFAHTLNGSALAVGRTLVAILENGQQADGSVVIPEVLRPYMGTDVLRPPSEG